MAASDDVWEVIRSTNDAWRAGTPAESADLFHEDAVMLGSSGEVLMAGRDAIVQSYVDYCREATTHAFTERDIAVHVFHETAIVRYVFDVDYETSGTRREESGIELLTLARHGGAWKITSRMQLASQP